RLGPAHALSGHVGDDVVPQRGPAAMLEAAPAVLVGPARRLHHAVERQVFEDDDSAQPRSSLHHDASSSGPDQNPRRCSWAFFMALSILLATRRFRIVGNPSPTPQSLVWRSPTLRPETCGAEGAGVHSSAELKR